MTSPIYTPQEISKGSAHVTSRSRENFDRTTFMLENMENNFAYKSHLKQNSLSDEDSKILEEFKKIFQLQKKMETTIH